MGTAWLTFYEAPADQAAASVSPTVGVEDRLQIPRHGLQLLGRGDNLELRAILGLDRDLEGVINLSGQCLLQGETRYVFVRCHIALLYQRLAMGEMSRRACVRTSLPATEVFKVMASSQGGPGPTTCVDGGRTAGDARRTPMGNTILDG